LGAEVFQFGSLILAELVVLAHGVRLSRFSPTRMAPAMVVEAGFSDPAITTP
jgi:hypothetical protein